MRAIGFTKSLAIENEDSLVEFEASMPTLEEFDVLVKVQAVSVNPVDYKVRIRYAGNKVLPQPRILGFDAVGIVEEIGSKVTGFKTNDRVYYAGAITRAGSNAEYQVVDSRIIAHAPQSLSDVEAAVLPLTSLTVWEGFFDCMKIDKEETNKTILIVGGAGGVGSIATQIAKQVTNLTVISTASRPETENWVKKMGTDYVANHHDLLNSVRSLGFETVDYIFNTSEMSYHWDAMVELIAPFGHIVGIASSKEKVTLTDLMSKAISFSYELMFVRSTHQTKDMDKQGKILQEIRQLVDDGTLKTTLNHIISGFSVNSIKEAHRLIESGRTIGKIGITYSN